jgi:hypothetical protein
MKKLALPLLFLLVLAILGFKVLGLQAQPYMITATNYASGFFGVVADETGAPLAVGSLVQLIWDANGDGMNDPSTQPGSWGMPTGDDVLMGSGQIGVTGGAPSAGTFVLPGTVSSTGGVCYLRAFHAATPGQGNYFSESLTEYSLPPMAGPTIYGIQFPSTMIRRLGATPVVTMNLTPANPPIVIGPGGGSFQYTLQAHNTTTAPQTVDLWIDVMLPNGSVYGPVLQRPNMTLPPNSTITRQMTQSVPGSAPPGLYGYRAHAGHLNPLMIVHEDAFPFEKQGAGSMAGLPEDFLGWETSGFEGGEIQAAAIPEVFFLGSPYPNPFNPTAQLQFGLPQPAQVRIEVYNILGSRVTTLVNKPMQAGYHSVAWHAQGIASGLYLIQMKAGGFVYTQKALLVK